MIFLDRESHCRHLRALLPQLACRSWPEVAPADVQAHMQVQEGSFHSGSASDVIEATAIAPMVHDSLSVAEAALRDASFRYVPPLGGLVHATPGYRTHDLRLLCRSVHGGLAPSDDGLTHLEAYLTHREVRTEVLLLYLSQRDLCRCV